MASSELDILITATNEARGAIDDVILGLSEVQDELAAISELDNADEARERLEALGVSAKKSGDQIKEAGESVNALKDFLEGVLIGAAKAGAAFLTFAAVLKGVRAAIREAAQAQQLDATLTAIGTAAGKTADELQTAVRGMEEFGVSSTVARQTATKLIQSEIDLSRATELAAAAQNLALISGQSTSEMTERLAFSVQTLNTRQLRLQGIFVSQEEANRRYAESMGKVASALTIEEQRVALLNEILRQSEKTQGLAAESIGNLNSKLADQTRLVDDVSESVGNFLLPSVSEVVSAFSVFFQNIRLSIESLRESSGFTSVMATAMRTLGVAINATVEALFPLIGLIVQAVTGLGVLFNMVTQNTAALLLIGGALTALFPLIGAVVAAVVLLEKSGLGVQGVFNLVNDLIASFAEGVAEGIINLGEVWELFWLRVEEVAARAMNAVFLKSDAELENLLKSINEKRKRIEDTQVQRVQGNADAQADKLQQRELEKARDRIKQINSEIEASERGVVKAREEGDAAAVDSAVARRAELLGEKKLMEDRIRDIKKTATANTSLANRQADRAASAKFFKAEQEQADKLERGLRQLIGTQGVAASGFTGLSAEGATAAEALTVVFKDFEASVATGQPKAFEKVRLAILGAFSQAKTVDDFSLILKTLESNAGLTADAIRRLGQEGSFRQQQLALQQMNAEMSGFIDATTRLRDIQKTFNDLVKAGVDHELAFQRVQAEVLQDKAKIYALELRQVGVAQVDATARFQQEQALLARGFEERRARARDQFTNERSLNAALSVIQREQFTAQSQSARTYYDSLRGLQSQYLAQYRQASLDVLQITREQNQALVNSETTIRELKRKGMTEEQAHQNLRKELYDQRDEVEAALATKDGERQKTAIARARQLAQQLVGSGFGDAAKNRNEAIRFLEDVQDSEQQMFSQQKKIAEAAAANAKTGLEQVSEQVVKVEELMKKLANDQIGLIKISVDQTTLDKTVEQIKSAFENIVVTVKTTAEGAGNAITGLAYGGLLGGYSPHSRADNMLFAGTAGEYVHPVNAVRYYGKDFMDAIRTLRFPRFASGGMLGGAGPSSGVPGPETTLNLSFNGRPVGRLSGSRDTVRALTDALKTVSKGVNG